MDVAFDHIAVGVRATEPAARFVMDELGAVAYEGGPGPGFSWTQWRFANGGVLEILEPDASDNDFLRRFLAARGPGIHHVTFKVPEIRAAMARAQRAGFDVVGFDDGNPGWKEAFLHPKQAQGIVVQLAESHPGLDEFAGPEWPFPPPADDPPAASDLVALRLVAPDADAARRLWCDVAGGEAQQAGSELELGWPGSPMRLRVRIDPAEPPGPRSIEVRAAAGRTLALSEAPHPVLGARFVAMGGAAGAGATEGTGGAAG